MTYYIKLILYLNYITYKLLNIKLLIKKENYHSLIMTYLFYHSNLYHNKNYNTFYNNFLFKNNYKTHPRTLLFTFLFIIFGNTFLDTTLIPIQKYLCQQITRLARTHWHSATAFTESSYVRHMLKDVRHLLYI